MGKRFLVVGHEARDHAIAWKLAQSHLVETVYVSDGNRAMPYDAKMSRLIDFTHEELADIVCEKKIDCTIVGDTSDMESGIVDIFSARGLPILGAHHAAAMLEGSKVFAKGFMFRHGIPTAGHRVCSEPAEIQDFLRSCSYPVVLKSDLRVASQDSAVIIKDHAQAMSACEEIFDAQTRKYDDEPAQVLLEEFIVGRELSYTILIDGMHSVRLITVRDYKRLEDGDGGPNTGGMGCYAPVPWLTPEMQEKIDEKIVRPTLQGMQAEGLQYRGFLYIGIMIDAQGEPWVLEYNTRLGDTEAESILMMLDDDLSEVALRAATGSLENFRINWRDGCAVSVALAPKGYPGDAARVPISLPFPSYDGVKCFGSILRQSEDGQLTTGPGRAACVTAYAPTIAACRQHAYEVVKSIDKDASLHYRTDIGLELECSSTA